MDDVWTERLKEARPLTQRLCPMLLELWTIVVEGGLALLNDQKQLHDWPVHIDGRLLNGEGRAPELKDPDLGMSQTWRRLGTAGPAAQLKVSDQGLYSAKDCR